MRRFLALVGLLGLLTACGGPPQQPPEEVLAKAAQKSQELVSARFTAQSAFVIDHPSWPLTGTADIEGVLQDGGEQIQLAIEFRATTQGREEGTQGLTLTGAGDVFLAGAKETYFRIRSFTSEPETPILPSRLVAPLLGQWWFVPKAEGDPGTEMAITPSPQLLRAQSQVVKVSEDLGIEDVNGRKAHRYAVALDTERMVAYLRELAVSSGETFDEASVRASVGKLSATGELWIDTETYVLHRVLWSVDQWETREGVLVSGTVSAVFTEHDTVSPITPPEAKPLVPGGGAVSQDLTIPPLEVLTP